MTSMTIEESLIRIKNAMKIGEYSLAEHLLKQIIERKSGYSLPFTLLGNVYERTGDIKKALKFYRHALRIRPDNVDAYNNLGIVYKNLKEYDKSLAFLNRALLLEPNRADLYYNLGNVYKEQGDFRKAMSQYEKAIAINPGFVPAYNNLGTVLELLGHEADAVSTYVRGLEADENNPRLHYNLGILYEKQNKLKQAKKEFEHALIGKPGWNDALLNLGIVLSKLSEHDKSIDTFQNVLKIDPKNVKAVNNLGIEYSKLKNVEKAKSFYKKALDMNPDYEKARLNLGTLLEDQGDYQDALETMKNLVKKKPHDIAPRFRLANIYTSMGNYKQAGIQFHHILKQVPGHQDTLRALGSLYLRAGKYKEANKCYNTLAETDPGTAEYHLDFAVLLSDKKKFEESEAQVKKFLAANPDDMNALSLLGELYFKQGYDEKAARLFETIIQKKPNIVKPYYYLARIYKKMGATDKAVEIIDKLITLQGTRQSKKDMEYLTKAIQLYESATKEYEKEFKVKLHKKISHLEDFSFGKGRDNAAELESDVLYIDDDGSTLLKTGGKEPLIPVKEELGQIKLNEEPEEEVSEPVVEIKDNEPVPLRDLLRNQELYDNIHGIPVNQGMQPISVTIQQTPMDTTTAEKTGDVIGTGNNEETIQKDKTGDTLPVKDKAGTIPPGQEKKEPGEVVSTPGEKESGEETLLSKNKDAGEHITDKKTEVPGDKVHTGKADQAGGDLVEEMKDLKGALLNKAGQQNNKDDEAAAMFTTMAGKLDRLINQHVGEEKEEKDTADEILLKVLENISEALNEKKHAGPFPAFYLPPRKKKKPKKKTKDHGFEDGQGSHLPKKNTRERLREFFRNIRKKLTEKKELHIPEDEKKKEYIQQLYTKAAKSKPFHNGKDKTTERPEDIREDFSKDIPGDIVKTEYGTKQKEKQNITIKTEPEELYHKKKPEIKETSKKTDIKKSFIIKEPVTMGPMDPENELIFEEALEQEKDSQQGADNVPEQEKIISLPETIQTGGEQKKKEDREKSFKPYIRPERKRPAGSLVVHTIQFFRKVINSIPGLGINTGIKNRLDNFLKKFIK